MRTRPEKERKRLTSEAEVAVWGEDDGHFVEGSEWRTAEIGLSRGCAGHVVWSIQLPEQGHH